MQAVPDSWRRESSKRIADCRVFTVREDLCLRDRDGIEASFFVLENPDWVNIIATTVDQSVVLITQFRHGVQETILEIPGGMVDAGEDPLEAAKRELAEETGYTSGNWMFLGRTRPNPAIQNNNIYHYLATGCSRSKDLELDDHESIVTELKPLAHIPQMIKKGEIEHSLVVAAFYFFGIRAGA